MSALSLKALGVAQGELAAGVMGGDPTRFRSPHIDEYRASVGRPADLAEPWCAEATFWCFEQACAQDDLYPAASPENPCPRTASAGHMWDAIPAECKRVFPAPGMLFFLDRGGGKHHVGFVEVASDPAGLVIDSVEPDTANHGEGATGDAWGRHIAWTPSDGKRGRLLGYAELG